MKQMMIVILGWMCLAQATVWAASTAEVNRQAAELIKNKNTQEAYSLLQQAYVERNYDTQTLFMLGIAARGEHNYTQAVQAFEEILVSHQDAGRVRLELGRTYYEMGEVAKAKEQFMAVQSAGIPAKVGETVNKYLDAIKAYPVRKTWSGQVTVGYLYDTNANTGPSSPSIIAFGLPQLLSSDGLKTKDHARFMDVAFNWIKELEENTYWSTDFQVNIQDYDDTLNVNSRTLTLSTGPVWVRGPWKISVPVVGDLVKLGSSYDLGEYYTMGRGIFPQATYTFNDRLSWNVSVGEQARNYRDNHIRNVDTLMGDTFVRYAWDTRSYSDVGVRLEDAHAKSDAFSYVADQWYARYYRQLCQNVGFYITGYVRDANYETNEQAFDSRRSDDVLGASATLSYFIPQWNSTIAFSYSHTDNNSNLDIYEYDRDMYSLAFTKAF